MKFGVKFHLSTEQALHNFSHASGAGILVPSWLTLALSEPAHHHRLILGSSVGANVLRHCRAIWCARHHVRGNVKHALAIAIVKTRTFFCQTYFWTGLAFTVLFFRLFFVWVRPLLKSGPPNISREAGPLAGLFWGMSRSFTSSPYRVY